MDQQRDLYTIINCIPQDKCVKLLETCYKHFLNIVVRYIYKFRSIVEENKKQKIKIIQPQTIKDIEEELINTRYEQHYLDDKLKDQLRIYRIQDLSKISDPLEISDKQIDRLTNQLFMMKKHQIFRYDDDPNIKRKEDLKKYQTQDLSGYSSQEDKNREEYGESYKESGGASVLRATNMFMSKSGKQYFAPGVTNSTRHMGIL